MTPTWLLQSSLESPTPEPQTPFMRTSKTGAGSVKELRTWGCPRGAVLPRDLTALQSSREPDTPGPPGSHTARGQAEAAEPPYLTLCHLGPGTAQSAPAPSCLCGQTPPSPPEARPGGRSIPPGHSTSLSSLKRKKCFLNKTNTAPNQTQGQTRAEPSKGRPPKRRL